jgi:formylglycine-generating enzyme required for sulfatase activity
VSGRVEVPGASRVYLKGEALSDEFSTYLRSGAFEFPQVLPGTYALRVALGNGGNVSRTIVVGDHDVVGIKVLPATVQEMAGEFVPISPGVFEMGCHPEDGCSLPVGVFGGAQQWIKPLVTVRIGKPFELGKHEVTQRQWEAVMGKNPAVGTAARGGRVFTDPDLPVANVSWSDAQKFIGKLNSLKDGYRYRLPTSAEWEYAARAGGVAPAAGGSLTDLLLPQSRAVFAPVNAWHAGNSGGRPHRVGELAPNGWGLHDMLGNVSEWVVDPAKKRNETTRGGTFQHAGQAVSAAMEQPLSVVGGPANGLRLARERVR